jgi:hypothetical protein
VNNAQGGDQDFITLAAAADEEESYYQNLRIVIPSGTGAGQYGRVAAYDNGSKNLYVSDERFTPFEILETVSATNELTFTTAPTNYGPLTPRLGDRVVLTGTAFGSLVNYTIYVISNITSSTIQLQDTIGTPITVTDDTGSMYMHKLGWNHFQPGYQIEPILNTTTLYNIEPRVVFSVPPSLTYLENVQGAAAWSAITYGNGKFVAVSDGAGAGGTLATSSPDGTTWTNSLLPNNDLWSAVAHGNDRFVAVTGGGSGNAAYSLDGNTWVAFSMPTLQYTGIVFSSIWGILIWGDHLVWSSWLGMAIILVSGMTATFYNANRRS